MVLQEIIFPAQQCACPELFIRGGAVADARVTLKKGDSITTDTYYNSFCHTKYRSYTRVDAVTFAVRVHGFVQLQLLCFDGEQVSVIAQCEGSGELSLSAELSALPDKGFVYARIYAVSDADVLGGAYTADAVPDDIRVCAAICTYKREVFVKRNLELMRSYSFSFLKRVFTVDNGNTLDAAALSDDFVSVLGNRNYGGSGGFTRGLIEAYDGGFTHVILMDDDIELLPQTLERMTVFVSLLRQEYADSWVSMAMLVLSEQEPYLQYEMGASWDGYRVNSRKHNADVRDVQVLADNLDNPDVSYGAWWGLCMPVSIVERQQLPVPFFIKFDDVEYGLRKPDTTEIITMNGIAVRHEAFDRKTGFVLDYYNLRNELAVNAMYERYGSFGAVRRFLYEVAKQLLLYRYDNMPLVLDAARHFLRGAAFLRDTDAEQLNSSLIKAAPKLSKLSCISGWDEQLRCDEHIRNNRVTPLMVLSLGGHLIPWFMLKKEVTAVPLSRAGTVDCFGKREVIQYQLGGDNGLVTRRSCAKFIKYGLLGAGMAIRLMFGFKHAKKRWLSECPQIISQEFWRQYLGL